MHIFISHCPLTYCIFFFENFDFEGEIFEKEKNVENFENFKEFSKFSKSEIAVL